MMAEVSACSILSGISKQDFQQQLLQAVTTADQTQVASVLEQGTAVNFVDENGMSPLLYAVQLKLPAVLQVL
jgi:hypothetical protein